MRIPRCWRARCDALVGACGAVTEGSVVQAKGFPYALIDLLGDHELVRYYRDGNYGDAAADLEHVSPVPCSLRLPRETGQLHFGGHLEC